MNDQTAGESLIKDSCSMRIELRDLTLHLYELGLYCELLSNNRIVYKRENGTLVLTGKAFTSAIAKWLRLAAQLESVNINTLLYQGTNLYCGADEEKIESDTAHNEHIITPLTRFIFVCNALEEGYRFISTTYESHFDAENASGTKHEYLGSHSAQAANLLRRSEEKLDIPRHYHHLMDNLRKIVKTYIDDYSGDIDISLSESLQIDYGLALVRNIRGHVAHGIFPIVENLEYSFGSTTPDMRGNLVTLLNEASRIAALSLQMLIAVAADGFQSMAYTSQAIDDDYGDAFVLKCDQRYLLTLHLIQDFGLNEEDYNLWISSELNK